jgi:hypothetical protein
MGAVKELVEEMVADNQINKEKVTQPLRLAGWTG